MSISRRTVMKYGLGGAIVLAAGGVGLSLRPTKLVEPRRELRTLSQQEFSIVAAFAETLLPGGDGWPTAWELFVPEQVDASLAVCHDGVIAELKQILALLESALAGALLDRRFRTFSVCSQDRRAVIIDDWRCARTKLFRSAFQALHGFCSAAYYNDPAVHALVGYPGVPAWVHERRLAP